MFPTFQPKWLTYDEMMQAMDELGPTPLRAGVPEIFDNHGNIIQNWEEMYLYLLKRGVEISKAKIFMIEKALIGYYKYLEEKHIRETTRIASRSRESLLLTYR